MRAADLVLGRAKSSVQANAFFRLVGWFSHQAANASRWARGESEYRVKIYGTTDFQWARRLSKNDIYRLYQSEASGVLDEDLLEEVGIGFYARCQTIKQVT